MMNTRVTSGMWRVDPLNRSRVIDRFGRTVATADSEELASLIATAPDMYTLLDSIENDDAIPHGLWEEIQFALRKARGDLGLIFSCGGVPKLRQLWSQEWLKFAERLWSGPLEAGNEDEAPC
jgi:hypothetical protein